MFICHFFSCIHAFGHQRVNDMGQMGSGCRATLQGSLSRTCMKVQTGHAAVFRWQGALLICEDHLRGWLRRDRSDLERGLMGLGLTKALVESGVLRIPLTAVRAQLALRDGRSCTVLCRRILMIIRSFAFVID